MRAVAAPDTAHVELLESSPFFEGLDVGHLERFGRLASVETFEEGEHVIEQGAEAGALYLLVDGKLDIVFRRGPTRGPADEETEARGAEAVVPIPATSPGHLVGWSAIVEPHRYRGTAVALAPTRMLAFRREEVDAYAREHPDFGVAFMRRVLWLVGGHLQATRMRMVSSRYEDGAGAIRALLDQSGPALNVSSPLHKIPHFLDSRLTLDDAFRTLDELQASGSEAERELAALIDDALDEVRLELELFQRLQTIYELVAGAAPAMDPEQLRTESTREFCRLFTPTRHVIRGEENLPSQPGHIFVMNHLSNHTDNFLPNDFILTLDTHFVSSMLLFQKYGVAPVRVVRKSNPGEYGHQGFYDRLGYIYVYSGHVDPDDDDPDSSPEQRRRLFSDTAVAALGEGKNIVICPEGTSTTTEHSPLAFKAGAFRLATAASPEPLIVPIAVANFDKKITRATTAAVVQEPFRLSDVVGDPSDNAALHAWLNDDFQPRFRDWVTQAAALAG